MSRGGGWSLNATGLSLAAPHPAYFTEGGASPPRLALRVFDNEPMGWFPWPRPAGIRQPTEVERRPELWAVVGR